MRKLLVAALVAAMSVFAAGFASQALAARTVRVGDDYFERRGDPPTVTVSRGTKVTWRWVGRNFHDVRVRKGPVKFHSRLKDSGRYSRTMRTRGTYKIICRIHQPDMAMTLRVR
jgi:plastocyanin